MTTSIEPFWYAKSATTCTYLSGPQPPLHSFTTSGAEPGMRKGRFSWGRLPSCSHLVDWQRMCRNRAVPPMSCRSFMNRLLPAHSYMVHRREFSRRHPAGCSKRPSLFHAHRQLSLTLAKRSACRPAWQLDTLRSRNTSRQPKRPHATSVCIEKAPGNRPYSRATTTMARKSAGSGWPPPRPEIVHVASPESAVA